MGSALRTCWLVAIFQTENALAEAPRKPDCQFGTAHWSELQDGCISTPAFIVAKDVSIRRSASALVAPSFSGRRRCAAIGSPVFRWAAATLVNFCFRQR